MNSQLIFTALLGLTLASFAAIAQDVDVNVNVGSSGSSGTTTTVVVVYVNGGATVVVVVSSGKRDLTSGNSLPGSEPDVILKIQYLDKQPDDEVFLWYQSPTNDNPAVDECLLSGHLADDPDVYVSVVGCPSSGEYEVSTTA